MELAPDAPTDAEVPLEAAEQLPQEEPMEAAEHLPADVPVEAAEQLPQEKPTEAAEQPPADVLMEAAEQPPADVLMEAVEQPPADVLMEAAEQLPQEEPTEAAEQLPADVPVEVAEQLPQVVPMEAAEQLPKQDPTEAAEQLLADVPMESVQQLADELTLEDAEQPTADMSVQCDEQEVASEVTLELDDSGQLELETDVSLMESDEEESADESADSLSGFMPLDTDSEDEPSSVVHVDSVKPVPDDVPVDLVKRVPYDVPVGLVKQLTAGAPVKTLEQLPDDVLVAVLCLLSVPDVLNCRLVSKRLGDVALHRDTWRHRTVYADYDLHAGAILRLAPCLRSVWVSWNMLLLVSTKCAVSELVMTVEPHQADSGIDSAVLAVVVRNQEALGRLKLVKVVFRPSWQDRADALMRTLAMTSGLEQLVVRGNLPNTVFRVFPGSGAPSIKNFYCELTLSSESFVNAVLGTHAATLKEVDLCSSADRSQGYVGSAWGLTFQLLSSMTNLRSLRCVCLPGLEAVAACELLTTVTLHVRVFTQRAIDAAAEFLRRADQLRSVALDFHRIGRLKYPELNVQLMEALASSGRSRLEVLRVDAPPRLQPLLTVLPSLTALRALSVRARPSADLLTSITPATAPSLRLLEILPLCDLACTHAWLHMWSHAVKAVLLANPKLHILVKELYYCDECIFCTMRCHREFDWDQTEGCYLYLHGNDKCPSSVDHCDTNFAWFNYVDFIPGL